jgi:hypothetical protein
MLRKFLTTTMIIAALIAASQTPAQAAGSSNPRALAMGDAYTALAYGLEAPSYNPANLGLAKNKSFSLDIFSVGVDIKNNSFSLADYNNYNGKYLNDNDKTDILNLIPSEGLKLNALAEASAMNFSVWRFALNVKGIGQSVAKFDRDPFELMLFGNAIKPDVSLSDTRGEALAVGDASLSYGQPLKTWQGGQLSVGASFHYLYGVAYEKIVEAQGGIYTTDTGYVGNGTMLIRQALGGQGQAVDLGVAVNFANNLVFSAGCQNVYSKIKWNKDTEETRFDFEMQPVTFQAMSDDAINDSLTETSDTTYDVASFSSTLPTVIRMGLARSGKHVTWSLDWTQGLSQGTIQSVNPRLSAGFEYNPISVFPMRIGAATGGNKGTMLSGGFGLYLGPMHIDMGLANYGTFQPNASKGATFACSMGFRF